MVYLPRVEKQIVSFTDISEDFIFKNILCLHAKKEQRRAVFCINLATNGRTTSNVRNTFILRKGSNSKVSICSISLESIELATAKRIRSLNTLTK